MDIITKERLIEFGFTAWNDHFDYLSFPGNGNVRIEPETPKDFPYKIPENTWKIYLTDGYSHWTIGYATTMGQVLAFHSGLNAISSKNLPDRPLTNL